MKRLLITILISVCSYVSAQKPVFKTYFDTAYWFSDEVDTADLLTTHELVFRLDTIVGNRYGKYSQFALKYVESVFGTKVGDGLCGRVGERMCELAHAEVVLKYRAIDGDMSRMEVGDIVVFPQFLEFIGETGIVWAYTPSDHLAMFMGMKNDTVMIIAHQNTENKTFYTKVVLWDINLKKIQFFKGNNKHVPYFDVYGYQPRKVLKKEYSFLGKQ